MNQDELFLARCIELAHQGSASGEGGPFGAVIVRAGKIIAEGWNRVIVNHDPTAHAEINAMRSACSSLGEFHLPDCILYTSSEPCPMCLSAAYWARIPRIVFANRRNVAASIGFCDDELYDELRLDCAARRIHMEYHPMLNAQAPLEAWAGNTGRISY